MTETLDLERSLAILRRRSPIILLCLLLAAGSALFFSKQQAKKYSAKSSIVFSEAQLGQQLSGLSLAAGAETKTQQATDIKLLEVGPVAGQVAEHVGEGLSAAQVKEGVKIAAEGESDVVGIEATAATPRLSAQIANTYARRFVADQRRSSERYLLSAQALVEKQLSQLSKRQRAGAQGLALKDREQSLAILAGLHGGGVEVAQEASVPTVPSSPKTTRNVALGAVLGLIIGLGIAFLIERLDRRIKDPEDLERAYGLPLLGHIPESSAYKRQAQAGGGPISGLPLPELEAMRMLRARLRYFNVDRDLRLVLVTSATSGDGKSTVALGLAEAAASMGARVLLVEADLRRPSVAKQLGLRPGPGLAEAIIGASTLEEAVQATALAGSVSVLTAGFGVPNPTGMIESKAIEDVLKWAASVYDLVLIDTPPLSIVPDAIPLLRKVDGVLVVGRLRKNSRDHAARLAEELKSLEAPTLGVVANGLKAKDAGYGYAYRYTSAQAGASEQAQEAERALSESGR